MRAVFDSLLTYPQTKPATLNQAAEWFLSNAAARDELSALKLRHFDWYRKAHTAFCISSLGLDGSNRALLATIDASTAEDAASMVIARAWFRARLDHRRQALK